MASFPKTAQVGTIGSSVMAKNKLNYNKQKERFVNMDNSTQNYMEFDKLQWVCNKPLPNVGDEVHVKINGIGRSVVEKYFVEHGFIGLIVQPQNPPTWYIEQNGADSPCHVFPAECLELQVRNEDGQADTEFYDKVLHNK